MSHILRLIHPDQPLNHPPLFHHVTARLAEQADGRDLWRLNAHALQLERELNEPTYDGYVGTVHEHAYLPDWTPEQRTRPVVYETITEGTAQPHITPTTDHVRAAYENAMQRTVTLMHHWLRTSEHLLTRPDGQGTLTLALQRALHPDRRPGAQHLTTTVTAYTGHHDTDHALSLLRTWTWVNYDGPPLELAHTLMTGGNDPFLDNVRRIVRNQHPYAVLNITPTGVHA